MSNILSKLKRIILSIPAVFTCHSLCASTQPAQVIQELNAEERENIVMTINSRNVVPCMYTMHQYNKYVPHPKAFYVIVDPTVTSEERDALTFLPMGVWNNYPQTQVLILGLDFLKDTLPEPLLHFYQRVRDPLDSSASSEFIAFRYIMPSVLEKLGLPHALLLDVDLRPGAGIKDVYSAGFEANQAILGTRLYANPYTQGPGNIIEEPATVQSDLTKVIISGGVIFMNTGLFKESIKNYYQSLRNFSKSGGVKGLEIGLALQQYWPEPTEDTVTGWLSSLANFIIQRSNIVASLLPSCAKSDSSAASGQLRMPVVNGASSYANVGLSSEEQFFTNLQQVDCVSRSVPMKYLSKIFNFNPNSYQWLSSDKTIRRYIENPQTLNASEFHNLIQQIQKFEHEFPLQQTEKTLGNLLKYLATIPPKIKKPVDWSDSAWLTQFAKQAEEAFGSKARLRLQQTYFNRDHPAYILDVKVSEQMEDQSYVTHHFDHQKKPETYSLEEAAGNRVVQLYQQDVSEFMKQLTPNMLSVVEKNIKKHHLAITMPAANK